MLSFLLQLTFIIFIYLCFYPYNRILLFKFKYAKIIFMPLLFTLRITFLIIFNRKL